MPRWVGKWGKYPAKLEQNLLPMHRLFLADVSACLLEGL